MNPKQLHILFIASWYPNRYQPVLGNFIQRHAEAIASKHKVSVVAAFSSNEFTGIDERNKGNLSEYVHHYPKVKEGDRVLSKVRKVKAYRNAIREAVDKCMARNGRPDIIHVHVAWPAALAVLPMAGEFGCPIVVSEHWSGYLPEDGNYKGFFLKRYTRNLVSKAQAVTVVSDKMKAAMHQHGLHSQFYKLPNAVNVDIFRNTSVLKPELHFRFLHVSMLVDREKNISGMLRAFANACKHGKFELTIVGDGPERKDHEALANQLGIAEKVHFVGLKSPEDIARLMNEHDSLLMFSNFEGMPVTIIEAQCCGMPVLATNTGAIREMLINPKDIIIEPGNEEQLCRAMQLMRTFVEEEKNIGEIRARISERAGKRYSYHSVAEELNNIYQKVIR